MGGWATRCSPVAPLSQGLLLHRLAVLRVKELTVSCKKVIETMPYMRCFTKYLLRISGE